MEKIRLLKQKKGFTLIELIVVITIIAILLALILPSMLSSDKPTAGKSYAKDYFYRVQSYLSRKALSNRPYASGNMILCVSMDRTGTVTDVALIPESTDHKYAAGAFITDFDDLTEFESAFGATDAPGVQMLCQGFEEDIRGSISSVAYDGTFFALVRGYRVDAAYWSDGEWTDLASGGEIEYSDENILESGYYCVSYPTEYCMGTRDVFDVPAA